MPRIAPTSSVAPITFGAQISNALTKKQPSKRCN